MSTHNLYKILTCTFSRVDLRLSEVPDVDPNALLNISRVNSEIGTHQRQISSPGLECVLDPQLLQPTRQGHEALQHKRGNCCPDPVRGQCLPQFPQLDSSQISQQIIPIWDQDHDGVPRVL